MKTQTRRFITALFCAVSVIVACALPVKVEGQGYINTYMGLGPTTPTQGFVNDVTYALQNGLTSYGSWQSIPNNGSVNISNIFYGGMYCALAVTSSIPFTLASIYSTQTSPFFSFAGTIGDDGFTYSLFGIGIAPDGTVYTSGNANTLVDAVFIVGYRYHINIGNSTLEQALQAWQSLTPFGYTVSYTENNLFSSGTVNFIDPVPEPSTIALSIFGGLIVLISLKKKNKLI